MSLSLLLKKWKIHNNIVCYFYYKLSKPNADVTSYVKLHKFCYKLKTY